MTKKQRSEVAKKAAATRKLRRDIRSFLVNKIEQLEKLEDSLENFLFYYKCPENAKSVKEVEVDFMGKLTAVVRSEKMDEVLGLVPSIREQLKDVSFRSKGGKGAKAEQAQRYAARAKKTTKEKLKEAKEMRKGLV